MTGLTRRTFVASVGATALSNHPVLAQADTDYPLLLGKRIRQLSSREVHISDPFRIIDNRGLTAGYWARIVSVNAAYAQQFTVGIGSGRLEGFIALGGDGIHGKTPTPWLPFGPLPAAKRTFSAYSQSWYFGDSRMQRGYRYWVYLHENGILLHMSCRDAGKWAHGGPYNTPNWDNIVAKFAIQFPDAASFNYSSPNIISLAIS